LTAGSASAVAGFDTVQTVKPEPSTGVGGIIWGGGGEDPGKVWFGVDVSIQQLRYFVAVAEDMSFTRAAAACHVAVPSLSQQISVMERKLNVELFVRTSRTVEMTSAGTELLPIAQRALDAFGEVARWSKHRSNPRRLRFGLPLSGRLTSRLLAQTAETFADRQIEFIKIGFDATFESLGNDTVDMVIAPEFTLPDNPAFTSTPLWSEQRVLVVSTDHRLADRTSISISESDPESFVNYNRAHSYLDWLAIPRSDNFVPRMDDTGAHSFEEVLDLCSAGLAVHVAGSSAMFSHPRPDIRYVPIADLTPVVTYLSRRATTSMPGLSEFADLLADFARTEADELSVCGIQPNSEVSAG
jgi:DNA-binding transcriptional LysR family regulator